MGLMSNMAIVIFDSAAQILTFHLLKNCLTVSFTQCYNVVNLKHKTLPALGRCEESPF